MLSGADDKSIYQYYVLRTKFNPVLRTLPLHSEPAMQFLSELTWHNYRLAQKIEPLSFVICNVYVKKHIASSL